MSEPAQPLTIPESVPSLVNWQLFVLTEFQMISNGTPAVLPSSGCITNVVMAGAGDGGGGRGGAEEVMVTVTLAMEAGELAVARHANIYCVLPLGVTMILVVDAITGLIDKVDVPLKVPDRLQEVLLLPPRFHPRVTG